MRQVKTEDSVLLLHPYPSRAPPGGLSPQLYLSPDDDQLYVRSSGALLAHFLSDFRSYNTSGTGIRRLALYSDEAAKKLETIDAVLADEGVSSAYFTATACFKAALEPAVPLDRPTDQRQRLHHGRCLLCYFR